MNKPVEARFVRFNWDSDYDAVNEVEVLSASLSSPR